MLLSAVCHDSRITVAGPSNGTYAEYVNGSYNVGIQRHAIRVATFDTTMTRSTPYDDELVNAGEWWTSYDYGWPALAVNNAGDLALGSVRVKETTYPQFRAHVRYHDNPTFNPDVGLSPGTYGAGTSSENDALNQFHMAGAASDPSTDGMYLFQIVQGSSTLSSDWHVVVAKMLGDVLPDFIPQRPGIDNSYGLVPQNQPITVRIPIRNQGDARALLPYVRGYLSTDSVIDDADIPITLSEASWDGDLLLNPGEEQTLTAKISIPSNISQGIYFGVRVDPYDRVKEHSEANNDSSGSYGYRSALFLYVVN